MCTPEIFKFLTLLLIGVLDEDDVLARLGSGESPPSAGLFFGILFIPAALGKESWTRGILTSS